jgi:hypothetical protein
MKRLMTFMMMAAVAAMVACTSETTEVAWINKNTSTAEINNIIWASGDQEWSTAGGYANANVQTEMKEVSKLAGTVECDIWNGSDFIPATINSINGNAINSLVLSEGSSEVFILEVN